MSTNTLETVINKTKFQLFNLTQLNPLQDESLFDKFTKSRMNLISLRKNIETVSINLE